MTITTLLLIVGLILIISEFVIPLFGLFALIGFGMIIAGSAMSFDPTLAEYGIAMILAISLSLSLIVGGGGFMAFKAYRKQTQTGKEGIVGDEATIIEWNGKQGRVMIDGENWHAEAEKNYELKKDDVVHVTALRDLTLFIVPKP